MKTLQLAVLAALAILAASRHIRPWRHSCPNKGQFFSLCAPPAPDCVPTCENPNAACRAPCVPGCKCPYGQVLDTENGRCVPKDHCPQVLCSLEPDFGFCRGYFPRYFHNSTSKQCEEFIYGGCGGNANKFRTLSQCQQTCRRSCRLDNGTKIKDGERYQPDPCTFCECDNGSLICAVVDCAAPPCDDYFVPPGECCPVCPPTLPPKCAAVLCPFVNCSGAVIPEGECCAVCPPTLPPKCASVLCLAVDCPGATIPEGECCAVCPPTLPPKCALVLCLAVDCPGATIPEGECCPVCPPTLPPKCASVQCAAVKCPRPIVPEGQCCPVCPKYKVCEYNGQTYLPGDSFPATDGCNTCTCSENGLAACTERACLSCNLVDCAPTPCNFPGGVVVPAGEDECCPTCGCRFGNETYSVGDSFPAGDGCNGCSCTSRGVLCTLIACESPDLES